MPFIVFLTETLSEGLRQWWRTTTSRTFLQSKVSRRSNWTWLWPSVVVSIAGFDICTSMAESGLFLRIALLQIPLMLFAFSFVWLQCPTSTMYWDVAFGGFILLRLLWEQLIHRSGLVTFESYVCTIAFFCAVGVHSSMSLLACVCSICATFWSTSSMPKRDLMAVALATCVGAAASVLVEYCLASLHNELQAQMACKQLLDCFTATGPCNDNDDNVIDLSAVAEDPTKTGDSSSLTNCKWRRQAVPSPPSTTGADSSFSTADGYYPPEI
eukprot:CAMPEP_0178431828 /NCGR_PEP_ID=MMETSP0689_2-20121128/32063_1 /TAXON_ID=160604 /ORGANISM="Amphidinium massartii, Strain CS-259" /LENGTH=269 /DNA_ID=CAMNT_0020053781 /DNA_START=109 /DNA_END=918 /DNA_ORIENTATION=+